MAKANLLDTKTVNFLELIGNGRSYVVPPYQRDYSWRDEQWEDLWSDILTLEKNPDLRHYMGALVVEAKTDREFLVIDGQQRLATLSILALAVISRLNSLAARGIDTNDNLERSKALRARYVGEKDSVSLIESSKLTLNHSDGGFYQDYLVQLRKPGNPCSLPVSNRLLWDCFSYFLKQLAPFEEGANPGESLARILGEVVARQLLFIQITVEDDLNAYTVFETLNARGLELTSTDLLKNYLFSLIKAPADLSHVQRRWRQLIENVRFERFPDFLRYHLLTQHPKIRKDRLFKILRERVSSSVDVLKLLDELEPRAELFAAISDPEHDYWRENRAARSALREINLIGATQITPLVFAGYERFSAENFARLLKLLVAISFRYSVISRLDTNELEPTYHDAAKALLTGEATSLSQVFARLRSIYVENEKFESDLSVWRIDTRGQRKKLAKYVLAKIESLESGRDCDFSTDPATIEHILPENPDSTWSDEFPEDRHEDFVYRLGNLTLLEATLNRRLGRSGFPEKVLVYGESTYGMTQRIAAKPPENWNPAAIEARQRQLAEVAARVWRSDFA